MLASEVMARGMSTAASVASYLSLPPVSATTRFCSIPSHNATGSLPRLPSSDHLRPACFQRRIRNESCTAMAVSSR